MRLLQQIARLIAPPVCISCGREGAILCELCRGQLVPPPSGRCFWCGRTSSMGQTCQVCRQFLALTGVRVAGGYDGSVRILIRRLKYYHQREAAVVLASLIAPLFRGERFQVVTSVPVATTRLRQRGYNQSELIARHVARSLGVSYRPLLQRDRNVQQVGKTRNQRLSQVRNIFTTAQANPGRILLIDDVVTTGATLNACATALKRAGATEVWGAAAARD